MKLTLRQRATWCAHLWKALIRQHHREMAPVIRPHVPLDGIVLDVGAHAGHFTKLFSGMCPRGHVHAFEPGSYACSILYKMRSFRRLSNVTIHPIALGDAAGTAALVVPLKQSGSVGFGLSFIGDSAATVRPTKRETVPVRRLDDVVEEHAISRVDFIKVDIEGSELRMLVGANRTLRRFRPPLLLEVSEDYLVRRGDSSEKLTTYLKGLDYVPIDGWSAFQPPGDIFFVPVQ